MNLIEKNWSEILEHVRKEHELSDVSFETWLLPLKVHSAENHVVKIIVPMGEQMITYLNSSALAMYRKWVSDKKRIPKDQFIALAAQLISAGILSIPGYLMSDSGRIDP